MAKVGSEHYNYKGTSVRHVIEIFFSKKEKFFTKEPKDLPGTNSSAPKYITVNVESYKEAYEKTVEYLNNFYNKGITCKKVILYYTAWCCPATAFNPKHIYGEPIMENRFGDSPLRSALEIEYRVRYLITVGGKDYISDSPFTERNNRFEKLDMNYPSFKMLDHTDELEAWFEGTVKAFSKLLAGVITYFGDDSETLLKSIEENKLKQLM